MRVTLTAQGYQGLKAEVLEILEDGAYVSVERKGIDLVPRRFYFSWDAIKGGKLDMPEAPKVVLILSARGRIIHAGLRVEGDWVSACGTRGMFREIFGPLSDATCPRCEAKVRVLGSAAWRRK